MWISIEIAMIHTFNEHFQHMKLTSSDNRYQYNQCLTGYIDDTNINITPTSHNTTSLTYKAISLWNEILSTSGGALSTTKCFYYDIKQENHQNIPKNSNNLPTLCICDKAYNRTLQVQQINNTTGK